MASAIYNLQDSIEDAYHSELESGFQRAWYIHGQRSPGMKAEMTNLISVHRGSIERK